MPLLSNATLRDLIWVSGSLLTIRSFVNVSLVSPKTVLVPSSSIIFLVQESALGFITKLPINETTLNGFTFSILDASGCSNITVSS